MGLAIVWLSSELLYVFYCLYKKRKYDVVKQPLYKDLIELFSSSYIIIMTVLLIVVIIVGIYYG